MKEERVFFKAGDLLLEGLYAPVGGNKGAGDEGGGDRGVVISHPHPQMGGCMMNNVVESMARVFFENGFSTLRFNFRGVGASEGSYDDGRGEQTDVRGAVACLREKGKEAVMLAGYSFGAWVNAKVLAVDGGFSPAIFVSPPLALLDFDASALVGKVGLVLGGDRDDFCSPEKIRTMAEQVGCRLKIIGGADHFFSGKEQEMARALGEYLSFISPGKYL